MGPKLRVPVVKLSNIGPRRRIGAITISNTIAHILGWIADTFGCTNVQIDAITVHPWAITATVIRYKVKHQIETKSMKFFPKPWQI